MRRAILPWWILLACGGSTPDEPTVAHEPIDPDPIRAVPEAPPPTPAPAAEAPPPATPCEAACTTLARCQDGPFADRAACDASCQASTDDPIWPCRVHASTCGAARLCLTPTKVRGRRADARNLVAPLVVALEYRRSATPDDAANARYTLVVRITDSRRTTRDLAVADVTAPDLGPVLSVEPAPADAGHLFRDERFHAGAGDNFEVLHAGDAIVVRHQQTDEQSGEGRWRDEARISLPRGSAVTAGTLPL